MGLAAVGLPRAAGSRWLSIGLSSLLLASLGVGATLAVAWPVVVGGQPPFAPVSWEFARLIWTESLPILRDFPLVGTGLGSFATIYPYVKTHDVILDHGHEQLVAVRSRVGRGRARHPRPGRALVLFAACRFV